MRAVLATICVLASAACAARPQAGFAPVGRANVSETLDLKLAAASVPRMIGAMQTDASIDDPTVSVRITPSIPQRRTTAVRGEAYVAALEDARSKAEAIAGQLGVRLGPVRAVSELAPDNRGGYVRSSPPMKGIENVMMQAPANGVVTLAVAFDAAGGPISVFGVHAGSPPPVALSDADGVWVTIQARAETFAIAAGRMRSVESALRSIARRYGASVVVSDGDANSY